MKRKHPDPELGGTGESAAEPIDLPRQQAGSQPQLLLLTLFVDYWLGRTEHLPSAALVALLGEFGVSPAGGRAALSRLARRNLLASEKRGRRTYYRLSPTSDEFLDWRTGETLRSGLGSKPWDGRWTAIAYSIPDDQRQARGPLRNRLRSLGFAALYDGLWISPHPPPRALYDALEALEDASVTVFVAESLDRRDGSDPVEAWDLTHLREAYDEFVARFGPLRDRVVAGEVGTAEALVARTEIMNYWRQLARLDPELPIELLGDDWPRADARKLFVAVYDALGPLAEVRFAAILRDHDPDLADLVSHFTSDRFLETHPASR
ncbi:MAG: PaaX family transcriptional regulator C-terminal domain-containing protein [Actinomycetota bacterium]|nr:PaaX family transcriptional regulator C-terminal domain-containing protein [Actinomycetota bacterium]